MEQMRTEFLTEIRVMREAYERFSLDPLDRVLLGGFLYWEKQVSDALLCMGGLGSAW